jgi:hypothetical protein
LESIHEISPATGSSSEGNQDVKQWVILWRTLILSSFPNTTFINYLKYIRVLALRDLKSLLDDNTFNKNYVKLFFSGKLSEFEVYGHEWSGPRHSKQIRTSHVVESVGDRLIQHCVATANATGSKNILTELDCDDVSTEALHRWIPQLPDLQTLRTWQGLILKGTGSLLNRHCLKFTSIKFYIWIGGEPDQDFFDFLTQLRPQTLQSVEIFSSSFCASLTPSGLKNHQLTLTELKLGGITQQLLMALPNIGECPMLSILHFEIGPISGTLSDQVKKEISNWMSSCTRLTDIRVSFKGPDLTIELLTPVLLSSVRLTKLELSRYDGALAESFHRALHEQTSLESLILKADGEGSDNNILVHSLCAMTSLRDLHLHNVGDYFTNTHIKSIAKSIPRLEELLISGWQIDDEVWPALSTLRRLRRLDMNAFSNFSLNGILGYIDSLGEGNRGFNLTITMANPTHDLTEEQQDLVRDVLAQKWDGRFDYAPARGK